MSLKPWREIGAPHEHVRITKVGMPRWRYESMIATR